MSKRKKYQKELGLELANQLQSYGWEIAQIDETFFLKKKYLDFEWYFGFHFRNQKIYKLLTFENISFLNLTEIVKEKFSGILDDRYLVVGFRTISEHIEASDITIDPSAPSMIYAQILSQRVLDFEKIYLKYSDESLVLKHNLSPRHWEWLMPPFLSYALFMIAYAEKYNQPELIDKTYIKITELKTSCRENFNGEWEKVGDLFQVLGYPH
ncbi:hypothetical protein [Capnocytophaga sp.]|uniref:hypothetical protein n=1 Tax=Capnocytophaga sp. TaxID=44737 RepID=UPI0026DB7582|nr:hypothetical protein [Capnocytophaga sp.]MDO5106076.1 hypothetical protein [Capnocytophaga sp.]